MKNTITLKPEDYIVFNGGLKIENVSKDNVITTEMPDKYTVSKLVIKNQTISEGK